MYEFFLGIADVVGESFNYRDSKRLYSGDRRSGCKI